MQQQATTGNNRQQQATTGNNRQQQATTGNNAPVIQANEENIVTFGTSSSLNYISNRKAAIYLISLFAHIGHNPIEQHNILTLYV